MTFEVVILAVLAVIIVVQQVYWMHQCQRLIDKLMSRSYGEVVLADKYKQSEPRVVREQEPVEDYAADQALKANQVFGL